MLEDVGVRPRHRVIDVARLVVAGEAVGIRQALFAFARQRPLAPRAQAPAARGAEVLGGAPRLHDDGERAAAVRVLVLVDAEAERATLAGAPRALVEPKAPHARPRGLGGRP